MPTFSTLRRLWIPGERHFGKWSHDFSDSVKQPLFDIDDYLSGDCYGVAKSLRDIHAGVQKSSPIYIVKENADADDR